jgi:hypothetical protein
MNRHGDCDCEGTRQIRVTEVRRRRKGHVMVDSQCGGTRGMTSHVSAHLISQYLYNANFKSIIVQSQDGIEPLIRLTWMFDEVCCPTLLVSLRSIATSVGYPR